MNLVYYYSLPFFISGAGIIALAWGAWRRRGAQGAGTLALVCFLCGWWSIGEGLLCLGFDTRTNLRITQVQYLGIALTPPMILLFSITLFGQKDRGGRYLSWLIFLPSFIILLLVWTNDFHHLYYLNVYMSKTGPIPLLSLEYGPFFWVFISISYIILMISTLYLIRQAFFSGMVFKAHARIVVVSIAIVWLCSLVYITGNSPVPHLDPTPITFVLVAGTMAWGFFRYRFLDLSPVARAVVFESMADSVLVVDTHQRIVDINPAAEITLDLSRDDALGHYVDEFLQDQPQLLKDLRKSHSVQSDIRISADEKNLTFDARISTLTGKKGRILGRLLVLRDITKRKRLETDLHRLATTDELTGVLNRRCFFDRGVVELKRANRHNRPFCVLMMDLDHFKMVNDTHGHQVGDQVLKVFARTMAANLRAGDLLGRMGGEEFAVIMNEISGKSALDTAGRLCRAAAGARVPVSGGFTGCTVSIGMAWCRPDEKDLERVIKRADRALYRAKAKGRNRVEADDDLAGYAAEKSDVNPPAPSVGPAGQNRPDNETDPLNHPKGKQPDLS